MNKILIKLALVCLLVTIISCKQKDDHSNDFIGVWKGKITLQDSVQYLETEASLQFISIDKAQQEVTAFLLYPIESVDTMKLSGKITALKIDLQNEKYELYGEISADSSLYLGKMFRIMDKDTLSFRFENPEIYLTQDTTTIVNGPSDGVPHPPQITSIDASPKKLTKEVRTYTVTISTEGKIVTLANTEFSSDGKNWQKSPEFKNVACVKQTFYARNSRNKSLQDKSEIVFECFHDIPLPTIQQLNDLLKLIADADDDAGDDLRKFGRNLPVRGVANITNITELIRDASSNSTIYTVQKIETDKNGNLEAIIISR